MPFCTPFCVCIRDGNGNSIGDTYASGARAMGNHLYHNGENGVSIFEADANDAVAPPANNAVLGNSIYDNAALGIDHGVRRAGDAQ